MTSCRAYASIDWINSDCAGPLRRIFNNYYSRCLLELLIIIILGWMHNNFLMAQAFLTIQDQNAFYGTTQYIANQSQYYFSLDNQLTWKGHTFKSGLSMRKLDLEEEVILQDYLLQMIMILQIEY